MPSLSETLASLGRFPGAMTFAGEDRLSDLGEFGSDPGSLRARIYVPAKVAAKPALVVALHGCTQNAAGYDHGTGWSQLADREGFILLFPEQTRSNNANLCFNWFEAADISRIGGEAESIAQMIGAVAKQHRIDPARVFITGLSAGGAMTAVMLATYPELFAAGAIIGGLPYGTALSVQDALQRMRGRGGPKAKAATSAVLAAGGTPALWPRVSLWHGTDDATVKLTNLERLGRQWRGVHQIPDTPVEVERRDGAEHRVWRDKAGRAAVEEWTVRGMGHGVPIDPAGPGELGAAGPYMLDVGLSSTLEIARSWGLVTAIPVADKPRVEPERPRHKASAPAGFTVQSMIEGALRTAGLMPKR